MRKYFTNENLLNSILLGIAVSLPFNIKINSIFIILFLVFSLYLVLSKSIILKPEFNLFFIFTSFFCLYKLLGLSYSDNIKEGVFHLEKHIAFFILPLLLFHVKHLINKKLILNSFAFSVIFFLIIHLLRLYLHDPLEKLFFVEADGFNLRRAFDMYYGIHPTYLSLFLLVTALILVLQIDKLSLLNVLYLFLALFSVCFIFILGARIIIISFLAVCLIFVLLKIRKIRLLYLISALLLVISSLSVAYLLTPSFKNRFEEIVNTPKIPPLKTEDMNSTNIRVSQLICMKQIISNQNLLFGEGIGDTQDILNSCYQGNKWAPKLYNNSYNFHNQYVQVLVPMGIVGLIMLIMIYIYPLIIAIKYNQFLLVSVLIIYIITSFTESVFETQKGIVFFSFFVSILVFKSKFKI